MFENSRAFSSFSVNNLKAAKDFYKNKLRLNVSEEDNMGLKINLPEGGNVFIYPKEKHSPASFTVLNFNVNNIDETVEELKKMGITLEIYNDPDLKQDAKGIFRGKDKNTGPDVAWFKDPAGNILSEVEE